MAGRLAAAADACLAPLYAGPGHSGRAGRRAGARRTLGYVIYT